jgi:ABC-type multidrug transport system fused ATPase/permease subunit
MQALTDFTIKQHLIWKLSPMAQVKQRLGRRYPILVTIWFFLKPFKLQVVALVILSLLAGGLEAATIATIYPILSVAFAAGVEQGGVILRIFGTMAGMLPIADEFTAFCVLFLILALLAFAVRLIMINFRVKFAARLVENNQNEIFDKFVKADYQYFIDHKQGELIYNTASAPGDLAILVNSVTELISQGLLSLTIVLVLLSLSLPGTAAVVIIGVGYYYFARHFSQKVAYQPGKGEMEAYRESNVILNEAISGIKQVKLFAVEEKWIDRFSRAVRKRWDNFTRRSIGQQLPAPILMFIVYLGIGITALLIRITTPAGFTAVIPVLGAFAIALFRLVPVIGNASGQTMQLIGALPKCETIYNIRNAQITQLKDGEKELSSFQSDITFNRVSFAYKGRSQTINDISVTFQRGKTTAIVGRSGTGKTTIINLILRLFDVDRGEIRIDGIDIKQYKISSWLDQAGCVSQDTFILNDTVANNITFGSDGYSREQVIEAARYADAHSFISELPDGYDTLVGDKGMRLSGGQAQRLAVARAMIRQPEVLIFDEATNNLDGISEAAVQKAIDEIARDHTVIIIAHRLSTVINADKIIVLGDGRVLEEGTHQELMEKKGDYWELYQSQSL